MTNSTTMPQYAEKQKQQIYLRIESVENGYEVVTRVQKEDAKEYVSMKTFVFHSLQEAMRHINNSISLCDMGPLYTKPRSIDYDEAEANIESNIRRHSMLSQDC